MKFSEHLAENDVSEETIVRPPAGVIMWCPGGRAVECPSIDMAIKAAENFSGNHPGVAVGVYQLVGFAVVPRKPGQFVSSLTLLPPASEDAQ